MSERRVGLPKLENFVFTEKLGTGTYATVYKAFKKSFDNREVLAVKCIQKASLNKASMENLLAEIEILKQIKHENIVELKDFQWDSHYIYLVMEYCGGGDLSRYIKSQRIVPEYTVKRFLQQIACALKLLHSHNISHMDLKPQNILLSSMEHPKLKLADFGFAQYVESTDEQSQLRGSPLYMAPEMITKQHYSSKVDLWSVGVILYESLYGQAPFASTTFVELENKIKSTEPIKLPQYPQISVSCHSLLLGLLQRDPDKRISFEDFFNHDFVDLEHKPSAECIDKARTLVTGAINEDKNGNVSEAVKLYSKAIEYFVPAIYYEECPTKRNSLRMKVNEYCTRAETLRNNFRPIGNANSDFTTTHDNQSNLMQLVRDKPELEELLKLLHSAKEKESEGLSEALLIYQSALEKLIPMLNNEPNMQLKKLLAIEIKTYLKKAEDLQDYITVQETKVKDREATNAVGAESSRCIIQ